MHTGYSISVTFHSERNELLHDCKTHKVSTIRNQSSCQGVRQAALSKQRVAMDDQEDGSHHASDSVYSPVSADIKAQSGLAGRCTFPFWGTIIMAPLTCALS
jgi:hypothetical protein